MKRIIVTVIILLAIVFGAAWLYFKNISSAEHSIEKVFNVIPDDASIIFEYKNEALFYDLFKDFTLFGDLLGRGSMEHLNALKNIFVDDETLSPMLSQNEFYFSLHKTTKDNADFLVIIPLNQAGNSQLLEKLKTKYQLEQINANTYHITFSNNSKFYFVLTKEMAIGSFDEKLLNLAVNKPSRQGNSKFFQVTNNENNQRSKNAIANLYINYPNLNILLNNFSNRKNPVETAPLKDFHAFSSLNINYQSDAFMFSGTTTINRNKKEYTNLFLNQNPGKNTLIDILPYDAASYLFYYVSDAERFKTELNDLLTHRGETQRKKQQVQNVSQKHSIDIEKELPLVLGNEFGIIQLASRDKLGVIKSNNIGRLSFIFETISSYYSDDVRRFNDSDLLYYFLGDPFKELRRPYYAVIENHIIVSTNLASLNRFLENYETQNFLSRTDKNVYFQQYLSNQGNIFYFLHNGNSKGNLRTFLSNVSHKNMTGENFDWKNIYGFSIQFSADKDKFFTNLYIGKVPKPEEVTPAPLVLDSLLN